MTYTRETPTCRSSSNPIGENLGWYDLPIVGEHRRQGYRARFWRRALVAIAGFWIVAIAVALAAIG